MFKYTNNKIIASGSVIEVFKYLDQPISYGYSWPLIASDEKRALRKAAKEAYSSPERLAQERKENRRRAMLAASSRVQRLVSANAWQYKDLKNNQFLPVFVTFTFAKDVRDVPTANIVFTKFIKRLNFFIYKEKESGLKYINVVEFQDKTRKGVVHYHTLFFNLPYVYKKKLEKIWDQGFIKIKKVDRIKNLPRYLTKYMVKGFEDPRLDGKKRYFSTRGLIKPEIIRNEDLAVKTIVQLPKEKLYRESEYTSLYVGRVKSSIYHLERGQVLSDVVKDSV